MWDGKRQLLTNVDGIFCCYYEIETETRFLEFSNHQDSGFASDELRKCNEQFGQRRLFRISDITRRRIAMQLAMKALPRLQMITTTITVAASSALRSDGSATTEDWV